MSTKPCCGGEGLKRGAWTVEEDKKLIAYIREFGEGGWRDIPRKAGLKRCGKSCRLRWANYLKPDIKRGEFSPEEDQIIIILHASRGNKWSAIAKHLPRRTDNEIKNYWNTHLKKRLIEQNMDPLTHRPLDSNPSPSTLENSNPQNAPSPHEQSRLGSIPPRPMPQSSGSNTKPEAPGISSHDGTPSRSGGSLSSKRGSSTLGFTPRLLNKVATRVTSMRGFLKASLEGSLTNPTTSSSSSSSLPYMHNAHDHFQVMATADYFDLLPQSSLYHEPENELQQPMDTSLETMTNTETSNFELNDYQEHDFSQFLDSFHQNDADNENNFEYSGRDNQMMFDISQYETSTTVSQGLICRMDDWYDYVLDHPI